MTRYDAAVYFKAWFDKTFGTGHAAGSTENQSAVVVPLLLDSGFLDDAAAAYLRGFRFGNLIHVQPEPVPHEELEEKRRNCESGFTADKPGNLLVWRKDAGNHVVLKIWIVGRKS